MNEAPKIAVILPAAGMSQRFQTAGGSTSKLEAQIGKRAALVRVVELFANRADVTEVLVAVEPDSIVEFKFKWGDRLGILGVKIVPGGKVERWETVSNALAEIGDEATHVAVHDAARPVTDPAMIDRVFKAAAEFDAVVPALPVHATVKRVNSNRVELPGEVDPLDAVFGDAGKETIEAYTIEQTVPREGLWLAQTPQVFERWKLVEAYKQIVSGKVDASAITDDAGLVEAMGETVVVVPGDAFNVKITVPSDVDFANAVIAMRKGVDGGGGGGDSLGPKRKNPTWAEMDDD